MGKYQLIYCFKRIDQMYIDNLINELNSFKHNENTKKLFLNAIKESFNHHFNNNSLFSEFYKYFNINKIQNYNSIFVYLIKIATYVVLYEVVI